MHLTQLMHLLGPTQLTQIKPARLIYVTGWWAGGWRQVAAMGEAYPAYKGRCVNIVVDVALPGSSDAFDFMGVRPLLGQVREGP
jgi:hypothetical protein